MTANPHPVKSIGGITSTSNVPKADIVGFVEPYVPLRLADSSALRALDLSNAWLVFIAGSAWTRDTSDTTASDDDAWIIRDGANNVWKKTPQLNAFDAYGNVADRDDFDSEDPGFTYFAVDEYGFYARVGSSGNWTSLIPFRGPRGGDVYDIAIWDNNRPASGEILYEYTFTRSVAFEAGLTTSRAKARAAATASSVFSLQKNGVEFGTMTFAIGATSATFAAASQTTFAAGDVLTVVAPNPRDDTLSGVHGTLAGTRN